MHFIAITQVNRCSSSSCCLAVLTSSNESNTYITTFSSTFSSSIVLPTFAPAPTVWGFGTFCLSEIGRNFPEPSSTSNPLLSGPFLPYGSVYVSLSGRRYSGHHGHYSHYGGHRGHNSNIQRYGYTFKVRNCAIPGCVTPNLTIFSGPNKGASLQGPTVGTSNRRAGEVP